MYRPKNDLAAGTTLWGPVQQVLHRWPHRLGSLSPLRRCDVCDPRPDDVRRGLCDVEERFVIRRPLDW
ncbi:MAG TPA: hypothetical protein DCY82_04155 [Acidimicrobiaceae bacterium]|nr:hypothetical protein [Acidimicrobiaceae bacterium]